ncbi:hypothetical protein KR038_003070 [Drosophila bunnanda]|nr:hypothetical protein KR038_003070 [Drosophila bunnanda]
MNSNVDEKLNLETVQETHEDKVNSEKAQKTVVEKSVAAAIEGSLDGAKEAPKKLTEKPRGTMLKNTSPEKKAQGAESDVDVKPIADTSAKIKKEVKPEAKASKYPSFLMPKKVDANPSWKRSRDNFGGIALPEEERPYKTPKTEFQLLIDRVVENQLQLMPKPVVGPEFIETAQREIENMNRRDLEDLVMRKVVGEKKAHSEFDHIRAEIVNTETKLATYRRKITEVSRHLHELNTMGRVNLNFIAPVRKPQAASQNVKGGMLTYASGGMLTYASGGMYPPSSGIPLEAGPSNKPKSDEQAPKPRLRPRAYAIVDRSSLGFFNTGSQKPKHSGSALVKTKEKKASNAPEKDSIQAKEGETENKAVKETDQPGGKSQVHI